MYAAYRYGQGEDDLGKQIWGIPIPDRRTNMGKYHKAEQI